VKHDAVLLAVVLAHLQPSDFGDGVGFVGFFQRTGEEAILGHRLGGEAWVNAGAAEEQQPFGAGAVSSFDDVGRHEEVVGEEFGWVGVVGVDAADFGGGENDDFGAVGLEEGEDGGLVFEVEL